LTRDFGRVRALDTLSLDVPAGIVFGFLGPNGAGKTTTIRLLLGLLAPTAGRAEVLGLDTRTRAADIRRQAGALLEYPGIYERLSAEDNLEFYGRAYRLPASVRQARIKELLTRMHLWERRKESPSRWSRGMRQKLALARVLLHRPALVFLDEPSAGLDPAGAAELGETLAALAHHEGVTVFLTTHVLAEAERDCQQVGIIRAGRLLAAGPPRELLAPRGQARVEIVGRGFGAALVELVRRQPTVAALAAEDGCLVATLRDAAGVPPLVRLLVEAGADIEEVRRHRPSLEEAYRALMASPL
jgi:ABC-2 type transport system ATP-binding protein